MVADWTSGDLEQYMEITLSGKGGLALLSESGALSEFHYPHAGVLIELKKYGLIDIQFVHNSDGVTKQVVITLLQELRDAVASDFEVSDYFLTLNAVGNIIVNSVTGPVQGVGQNTGVLHQTVEQLADYIGTTLGREFLETQEALRISIEELRGASAADQPSKLGKVVSELGRCLQHGANAAVVVSVLPAATAFLQALI